MTKAELIKALEPFPEDMQVFLESTTEFQFGLVNSAEETDIIFREDPDGPKMARVKSIVLRDQL